MSHYSDFHFAFYKFSSKDGKIKVKNLCPGYDLREFLYREKNEGKKIAFLCSSKNRCDAIPSYSARELFGMDLPSFYFSKNRDPFTGKVPEGKPRYTVEMTAFDYYCGDGNVKKSALPEIFWEAYLGYQEEINEAEEEVVTLQSHEDYDFIFFDKADDGTSYEVRSIKSLEKFCSAVAENLAKHRNSDHFWFACKLKSEDMNDVVINSTQPRVNLLVDPITGIMIKVKISWWNLEESEMCSPENLAGTIWETYRKIWDQADV